MKWIIPVLVIIGIIALNVSIAQEPEEAKLSVNLTENDIITPSSFDKDLGSGRRNILLFDRTMFAEDKGEWVDVDKATSLKDYFNISFLEQDDRWNVTIHDFNWTWMNYTVESEDLFVDIKLNAWNRTILLRLATGNREINFKLIDSKLFDFDNISFGDASTTIQLIDRNSEVIEDVTASDWEDRVTALIDSEMQFKFNITKVPTGKVFEDATYCNKWFNDWFNYPAPVLDTDSRIYRVNDQNWDETLTLTEYDQQSLTDAGNPTWSTVEGGAWGCINVTTQIKVDYDAENTNSTLRIEDADCGPPTYGNPAFLYDYIQGNDKMLGYGCDGSGESIATMAREADASASVYLNITYSEAGDSCDYSSGDFEIDCSENCTIDTDADVGGNDIIFTGAGEVTVNATIINVGNTTYSTGCTVTLVSGITWTL